MDKYRPVIGFEVHLQPKTNSKMFCGCNAKYFGEKPNTHTCPVCLGLPGALPVPNKASLDKCILLSLALNCFINKETKFDRKNYFYPDLPKGYQISQYDKPVGHGGFIEFDLNGDSKRIRITRVHQEEDTAKSIHENDKTLIDFNKSGLPLIEIVTEPDFESIDEIEKFAKRLRQIVRYLDISDADMEKGQMRYELNMSLKKPGETGLPDYKVEVKNIASISVLKKVVEYEYKRQSDLLDKGEKPVQETRGIRDMSGETYSQRVKEGAEDYRYFPEPDIPPIEIDEKWQMEVAAKLIELPQEKKNRYMKEYKIDPDSAEVLVSAKTRAMFFEKCIEAMSQNENLIEDARSISKLILGDLARLMKISKTRFVDLKIEPSDLVELVIAIRNGRITGTIAKQVLEEAFKTGTSAEKIIKEKNLEVVSDSGEIEKIVDEVIKSNPDAVESVKKNPNAIKYLVGQVMKASKGKANPSIAEEILSKKLR